MPNRQQAIIQTIEGLVYLRKHAPLDLDDLTLW